MSNPDIYLLGAGDHGLVLLDALSLSDTTIRGVVDPARESGSQVSGISVVDEASLLNLDRSQVLLVNGVGGRNSISQRHDVFRRYTSLGFTFRGVIHPEAIIARDCLIDSSAQIMAAVVVQTRAHIGANAVVNTSSVIEHDCVVGVSCFIGPRSVLAGRVRTGDEAFVGAGVTVLPGITIGSRSVVGAGSVVTRDVVAGQTVMGNPARSSGPAS